ncbi:MAG: 1-deoxy-D-xylulose-5-phosphate synthase N-terminal domain-containing protein [Actinomycetota bacterium]
MTLPAPNGNWQATTQSVADRIRTRVLDHVLRHNGGYMSQALSSAEIFAMLYTRILNLGDSTAPLVPRPFSGVPGSDNPDFFNGGEYNGPKAPEFDRFIFSPAHYALVLYTTLIEVGRLAEEGLEQFDADGSTVEMIGAEHSPGVETTTGSLSQALSQAGGIALARKRRGDTGKVWVMMSDGEFQEGQIWEAISEVAKFDLDNLKVIVDVNGQQCDGCLDAENYVDPLTGRIQAFGASAIEVDGHDLGALNAAMSAETGKPHFVMALTNPTRGLPIFEERAPLLHYLRFVSDEEKALYEGAYEEMVN